MENSKNNELSRDKILSAVCLIIFILLFIFSCMPNSINFGAKLVGTFGIFVYPLLISLSLICFAKFLGFSYKRSIKATVFMICFIYFLLLVIHSIRTYSILDSVASGSTFKEYLDFSYSNYTLLGSIGCLLAGSISYLIGGMGAIVVFVIFATIFIGLFIDFELYGKYEQKHIRKLHSRKIRDKVLKSDAGVSADGQPNYSFSNSDDSMKYTEDDVVAEITANYNETQTNSTFKQKQYSQADVVDEITDNQVYDDNQSYYGMGGDQYGQYNENYPSDEAGYEQYNPSYSQGSNLYSSHNDYSNTNPFGDDAVQSQTPNHFSKNVYNPGDYPNVYDENEERRKFLQATFNTDYNSNEINPSYESYSQESGNENYQSYNNSQDVYSQPTSFTSETPDDSERLTKKDMEWKFNDDDFNYSYQFNGDEDVNNSSNSDFSSSMVDDKISEILNSNDNIESSIQNDYDNNYTSLDSSNNDFSDITFSDNTFGNFSDISNNTETSNRETSVQENNQSLQTEEQNVYPTRISEPTFTDLNNVTIPAKEPEKKTSSNLKMGLVGVKYNPPPLDLLNPIEIDNGNYEEEQERKAKGLEIALKSFNIPVSVANIIRGPKITRYELSVPLGVSIKKIPSYELDIKKTLSAKTINIQAPIPGTEYVGIELENDTFTNVFQRELLESKAFKNCTDPLPIAIGKDISGEIVVGSLAKMVHLLIAGQTGSGKSVFIHNIIISLIYKYSPDDLRLVLIDPKRVEFNVYNGLPHLMTPEVVMGTEKAVNALKWCVKEMDRRYDLMSRSGYRDIVPYNNSELVKSGQFEKLPYIVIVVDEFAEVIMANKKEAEACIQRITQLARACGMHLVLATQRPSVDVMSGIIKNNVPSRIAFSLSSAFDSKTILGTVGAENLLGKGDMLYKPNGTSAMYRLQASYCTDEELRKIIEYDIKHNKVNYDESVENMINAQDTSTGDNHESGDVPPPKELDPYFKTAIKLFMQNGAASTSYLQRRLQIGYARAGRIMDQLENRGYIGGASGSKTRKVIITPEQYKRDFGEDIDLGTDDNGTNIGEF